MERERERENEARRSPRIHTEWRPWHHGGMDHTISRPIGSIFHAPRRSISYQPLKSAAGVREVRDKLAGGMRAVAG
jgi:hypothetical protein